MNPRPAAFALAAYAFLVLALAAPPVSGAGSSSVRTDHFEVVARDGCPSDSLQRLATRLEATWDRAARLLGRRIDGDVIVCHVFPTLESKGLATGYTMPAHSFSGRGEMYVAVEEGFGGDIEIDLATLLLRRALGRPRTDMLEDGMALLLAGNWRGREGLEWVRIVTAAVDRRQAASVFSNRDFHAGSPLVGRVLAAGFVSHAIEIYGRDVVLDGYASWRADDEAVERWLQEVEVRYRGGERRPRTGMALPSFQRGFCHAHEGYNVLDGYVSRQSDEAIERLSALGTNAVSLTPFTYMRDPSRPVPLRFSQSPNQENDESVVHAARTAQRQGMIVMLKPHVWLGGSWPGEIEMKSEADWDRFFSFYLDWILHYALLAEMYEMEILCAGVELSRATVGNEARWVDLFERVRRVYGGALTYAANWGGEFEGVSFWEALDFVGVNCYYPLSEEESAGDEALFAGANRAVETIVAVSERYGRPALITEVGFTSSPAPWRRPHERSRGVPVDQQAQARCYEVFFRALEGRDAVAGVYWWKWPSFLGYGGPDHAGFTPNRKAAERVIEKWYGEILAD